MARKDASRIKVLFFRNKDYEEAVKHLQCVINNNAGKLYTVLRSGALHPLDIDAYEVKEGTVTISSKPERRRVYYSPDTRKDKGARTGAKTEKGN